ncbi:MAG TPA: YciI family protein [Solirubrobacterales bacterium]|jgi:uncharacterized protein YciI|nr:YciI family protein [Solirubrobacterales bacterium]
MPVVLLSYEYVADILERRKPHREAHLAHVERTTAEGGLVVAGAVGDPPHGAVFVFEDDADAAGPAAEFAAGDPYVAAGLVSDRRIEPWTVVSNAWASRPGGR